MCVGWVVIRWFSCVKVSVVSIRKIYWIGNDCFNILIYSRVLLVGYCCWFIFNVWDLVWKELLENIGMFFGNLSDG